MTTVTPLVMFPAGATLPRPTRPSGLLGTALMVARRSLLRGLRSPHVFFMGLTRGAIFLLIFRYVFGGAISSGIRYVDFLVPGFVAVGVLFSGMSSATAVAEDVGGGLFDRLRSLPVSRLGIVAGRVIADTASCRARHRRHHGRGLRRGLPDLRFHCRPARRGRSLPRGRLRVHLGLRDTRSRGRQSTRRPRYGSARLSVRLRVERVRSGGVHAWLDAGLRRASAAHAARERHPGLGGRRRRGGPRPQRRILRRFAPCCGAWRSPSSSPLSPPPDTNETDRTIVATESGTRPRASCRRGCEHRRRAALDVGQRSETARAGWRWSSSAGRSGGRTIGAVAPTFEIAPVSGVIGAEVHGLDLAAPLDDDAVAALAQRVQRAPGPLRP